MTDFSAIETVFNDLGLGDEVFSAFKAISELDGTDAKLKGINDFIKAHLPVDIDGIENKTCILYSGDSGILKFKGENDLGTTDWEVVSSHKLAKQLAATGKYAIIDDTKGAKLLESEAFVIFIIAETGLTPKEFDNWAYQGENGPWSTLSEKYVSNTMHGDVVVIGTNPRVGSVMLQTEINCCINNPKVTSINGDPTEVYRNMVKIYNGDTLSKVFIDMASSSQFQNSKLPQNQIVQNAPEKLAWNYTIPENVQVFRGNKVDPDYPKPSQQRAKMQKQSVSRAAELERQKNACISGNLDILPDAEPKAKYRRRRR